jgi:uncharacterized membrane protein
MTYVSVRFRLPGAVDMRVTLLASVAGVKRPRGLPASAYTRGRVLTRAPRERLSGDVQLWQIDGLIDQATADLLRRRYQARSFGAMGVVRYLGIGGGALAFLGLVGLVVSATGSTAVGGIAAMAVGAALLWFGIYLALDPERRYALSSKVVEALGAAAVGTGIAVECTAVDASTQSTLLILGLVELPVIFGLAYRFKNPFLLILGLLGLFHWVGSWNQMVGRSTYELSVQDPKVMALTALAVFGVGIWHERELQDRTLRFFVAYESIALAYFNLSLLILSIDRWSAHGDGTTTLAWTLVFTAATIGQIVLGARLQNALVLGFGVTCFAINLYTRYFEHFWDRLAAGWFFLLGGLVLLSFGIGFERLTVRTPPGAATDPGPASGAAGKGAP